MPVRPKKKCCLSKPRCRRCPVRMMLEGTLSTSEAKKLFAKSRNKKALKKARAHRAA